MRRVKKSSIIVLSATLVAGVLSIGGPAAAATTAVAGIPITMENSGKCLNVAGASADNGAKVIQYTCVPTASNDKWVLVPVPQSSGAYQVQNIGSGKCLTVLNASTANNASLIQYTCTTGGNEIWYVDSPADRPTLRLKSDGSGLCLDVPGRSTDNNVNLIQYTCQPGDGTPNERFTVPPTTSATPVNRPFTSKQPVAVIQGGREDDGGNDPIGTAPVSYNWIDGNNQLHTVTDYNPDVFQPDPNAPAPYGTVTTAYGYTGRPAAALLDSKRVQVVAHNAQDGDVQTANESQAGSGLYGGLYDLGGAMDAQPTVGTYAPGQLAIYAVINGALWFDPETPGDFYPPYGNWRSLGGPSLTGVPAVVPNGTGAQIFATDAAGEILTATLGGTTLGDWTDLGGSGLGDPSVVPLKRDRAFVTARAGDGSIAYKEQAADGTWPADWTTIAGVTAAGNPSAVIGSADGRIEVAIRGTDNLIYVAQETEPASGEFSGWVQISDPATDPGSVATGDPTAFAYDVPSGQSFAVVFPNADSDANGPYGIYFPSDWSATPPPASVSRAASARAGLHYRSVPEPKKLVKLTAR